MIAPVPDGARCGRHPEAGAVALCARCGDFLCEGCAIAIRGESYCADCEEQAGEAFPWERRDELGIARALLATTIGTLVRTRSTFAPGFRDRSVVPALLYAIAVSWPVAWIRAGVELAWQTPERAAAVGDPSLGWLSTDAGLLGQAIASPLVIVAAVTLYAAPWWLGLALVGVRRLRLSAVVRAVAYTQGATAPLTLVTLLPAPAAGVLTILGTAYALWILGNALAAISGARWWRVAGAAVVMVLAMGGLVFLVAAVHASVL